MARGRSCAGICDTSGGESADRRYAKQKLTRGPGREKKNGPARLEFSPRNKRGSVAEEGRFRMSRLIKILVIDGPGNASGAGRKTKRVA